MTVGVPTGQVRWLLSAVTLVVACAVLALHVPGHVSMDTSIQLHEAHTGISESWNPPFMSALMRWLGGGEIATTALVLLQVLLLQGGTLLAADALLRARERAGQFVVPAWALLAGLMVVLNPIVALYAGIVWKDVLFAALLVCACSLSFAAIVGSGLMTTFGCATGAVLMLAAASLTRQQGVFMAPVLLMVLLAGRGWGRPVWRWVALVVSFAALTLVLQQQVEHAVRGNGARSTSVGFRSIMIFDMMGILARTQRQAADLAVPITAAQLEAIRRVYQPSRIDYIANDPAAEGWVVSIDPAALRGTWWALVRQNPLAWLAHKLAAFSTLLGLRGLEPTQPMHIGVDGNPAYLHEVGLQEKRGPRDLLAWRLGSAMFGGPLWRHAFWLLVLAGLALTWWRRPLAPAWHRAAGCIMTACVLFYTSFIPTMISSDFRYLFGAIPLEGLVLLMLALGPRPQEAAQ